jgi:hypothetical protein
MEVECKRHESRNERLSAIHVGSVGTPRSLALFVSLKVVTGRIRSEFNELGLLEKLRPRHMRANEVLVRKKSLRNMTAGACSVPSGQG